MLQPQLQEEIVKYDSEQQTNDKEMLLSEALCRYSCSYEPGYDISIPDGVTSAGDWNQHGTAVAGDDVVAECIELIESRKPT